MCEEQGLADWQVRCIEQLLRIEGVEAALLIMKDGESGVSPNRSVQRSGRKLLWRSYRRFILDRKSSAAKVVPWPSFMENMPVKRCGVEAVGLYAERLQARDVAEIREHKLDFILRFGFGILKGEVLQAARLGIWSFHHGDPSTYRGMPPGFWEIHDGVPVTGAVLQRLTERLDAGVVLHQGYFQTRHASYVRSRDELLYGTSDWPVRVCKEVLCGEEARFHADPITDGGPIKREPSNWRMLQFFWRQAASWVINQCQYTFLQQQWSVGVIAAPVHEVTGLSGPASSAPVQWLSEPSGRFLADPFAVERADGSGLLILAEDYDWNLARGRIASVEFSDAKASSPCIQLDLPCHLSYPYLFRHGDRLFCVPEASASGEVRLYALNEKDLGWQLDKVLIEQRRLLDSTIFQFEGRWWLFATDEANGPNLKLHAWFADELHGPWREHPLNPLKTDVRSARPAGRPFLHEGHLYRPAQDCSLVYGGGVALNRIKALTPRSFEEETVRILPPAKEWRYSAGFHTLCGEGKWTIVDACRSAFVPKATADALLRKARSLVRK
jgi:hypothetical protein